LENQIDVALAQYKDAILKAAETISTYTFSPDSRSVFSPENMDEKIKLLVPTDTPTRNRFPRKAGMGQAAAWKRMTSKLHAGMHPGDVGTKTAIGFVDAGAPNETAQTYDMKSAAYKLLGRKVEVGGLALAASKGREGQPDMLEERENTKLYEVMLGEEEMNFNGVASTTQFDGLAVQITTYSGNVSFLTASGVGSYCNSLFREGADPTLLIASARQNQALADDLEKTGSLHRIAISNQAGAVGGMRLAKLVNPVTGTLIDVEPGRYVGYTAYLLTEKSPAGEAWIEADELIPMSRVDVPSSNFSFIRFVLEALALKVIGEPFQYEINTGAVS